MFKSKKKQVTPKAYIFNPKSIKAVIGLGNPDEKYKYTAHNAGHLVVEHLALSPFILSPKKLFWFSKLNKTQLIKTNVAMNFSGNVLKEVMTILEFRPEELVIVHDDSDIVLGNSKLSFGKHSAGHRGVESIFKMLKTDKLWRLRIGIRPAREKVREPAMKLVLKELSPNARKSISEEAKKFALTLTPPPLQKKAKKKA